MYVTGERTIFLDTQVCCLQYYHSYTMTVFQLMNRTVQKMHDLQMAKLLYILNPSQNMKDLSLIIFWTQLNSSIWSCFNIYYGSMKSEIQADFKKSFPNLKTIQCYSFIIHENNWVYLLKSNNEFVMICYFLYLSAHHEPLCSRQNNPPREKDSP